MRVALVGLLVACSHADDTFFVRRNGADLPVWRQGPADTDTVVLVTHGSGASGRFYDWFESFDRLEREVAVVYWDQRGAGISQGPAPRRTLTVSELVADLTLVRDAVVDRYAPARLVLLGHSLGGGLTLTALRDPAFREGVHGYVDVAGARHSEEAFDEVRAIMRAVAEENDRPDLTAFYEAHVDLPQEPDVRAAHAANTVEVNALRGFDQEASDRALQSFIAGRSAAASVAGGFDLLAYLGNTARFVDALDFRTLALEAADLAEVDVPTLFVTGAYDLSVPPEFSERTFEALDPDRAPAAYVELEAGHWPMFDAPEGFADAVLEFLDALPE